MSERGNESSVSSNIIDQDQISNCCLHALQFIPTKGKSLCVLCRSAWSSLLVDRCKINKYHVFIEIKNQLETFSRDDLFDLLMSLNL
uniref:Uncharacterized protein n=1 Tax=Onchocerca volvulus TaxID=6282 RepID=A0A8R1Y3C1_ONCVO